MTLGGLRLDDGKTVRTEDTVHIGRQPVYARSGSLYGYELLFRPASRSSTSGLEGATGANADAATTTTILAAFSQFTSQGLLGGRFGFINLTRAFLVGDLPLPFDPDGVVLEVLETVTIDEQVVDGVRRLRDRGFRIALDDFAWAPEAEPLLALADIVKIDVLDQSWDDVLVTVERCRPHGVTLLAERVEDEDMLLRCRAAGFELFQGYHLGRPQTLSADGLAPNQLVALRLVAALGDAETTAADVEDVLRQDPALTYRLLRIANSAAYARPRPLSSLRDAVVLVGLGRLRAWLVLAGLSAGGTSSSRLTDAIVLARTCEIVTREAVDGVPPEMAFTLGLLRGLADSLGVDPGDLARGMPALDARLAAALVDPDQPGRPDEQVDPVAAALRGVLDAVLTYGSGTIPPWPEHDLLTDAYLEALVWAETTQRGMVSAAD